ncbi:hypothetical protein HPG69_005914, partial [Diceros bicornis minor]
PPGPPWTQSCGNKSSRSCWEASEPLPSPSATDTSQCCPLTTTLPPLPLSPLQATCYLLPASWSYTRQASSRQHHSVKTALPGAQSALESHPDPAILPEEESGLLLAALVKDYVQMRPGSRRQRAPGILQHCHLHDPSAGKLAEQIWGVLKSDFMPTDVGPESYGRHRRDLQA